MPSSNKRPLLATNIAWLYGLQGLNYLVPAALLPYLVRTLGVEHYGLIAFAQAIAQYFTLVTDYGFNFSATRSIAAERENREEVSHTFWTVMTLKCAFLVVGFVLLEFLIATIDRLHEDAGIYRATYLMVVGNAIFPLWLFQGLERMRSISIATGIGKLLAAILVVMFVKSRADTLLAALLLSSGFGFAGLLGLAVALRRHVDAYRWPGRGRMFAALNEGRHLFLTTAAVSLYTNTNTFLVGALAGVEQAGYFSLADKLIRAIGGIVAPIIQAAYPHTIGLMAESRQRALRFIRGVMGAAISGGVLCGIGLLLGAEQLATLAFSHQADQETFRLLRILALFPLISAVTYVYCVLLLIPFGFDKVQSRMLLAIGIVNVALGCLLVPRLGAIGGVWAMTVTELLQVLGSVWILRSKGLRLFRLPLPVSA